MKRDRAAVSAPLGAAGRELVRVVESNHPALDPVARLVLGKLGALADRAAALRVEIDTRGAIVPDRWGVPRPHPGIDAERKILQTLADAVRKVCGTVESVPGEVVPGQELLD